MWLILFDYYKETPKTWFLSELRRFLKAMMEYSDVIVFGVYEKTIYGVKIDEYFLEEGIMTKIPVELDKEFDGIVFTVTTKVIDNWMNDNEFRLIIKEILNKTRKNSPVIICSSENNFKRIKKAGLAPNKKLVFHKKIKIKSFNFSLQNRVLNYIKN